MSYQIKLNVFEGPYDLLLFLIRKGEVDIYDIPIAKITKEYLEYIEFLKSLDLGIAGEFIVVAATLMRIKAKMLLPVYIEEDEEIEDPRLELVQNLLEYQRIKDASFRLQEFEADRRNYFPRGKEITIDAEADAEADDFFMAQISVYELMSAYNALLKKESGESFHYVEPWPFTVEEQMNKILKKLGDKGKISFNDHFMKLNETIVIVLNFLALLELVNKRMIRIGQAQPFHDIWIYKAKN
ncbi:MAG: segregation/condensation protein A [bacterium]|nr:segregation/condensation protein A [bacterium]